MHFLKKITSTKNNEQIAVKKNEHKVFFNSNSKIGLSRESLSTLFDNFFWFESFKHFSINLRQKSVPKAVYNTYIVFHIKFFP